MLKSLKLVTLTLILPALVLSLPSGAGAQSGSVKRPLTHDDYDSWMALRGSGISADGNWAFYLTAPRQEGQAELIVKNLTRQTEYRHILGPGNAAGAAGCQFSYDSKYLVFFTSPSQEEIDKAKEEEADAPQKKLTLMKLADGSLSFIEEARNFQMPAEAGGWLAYLMPAPQDKSEETAEEGAGQRRGGQRAGQRRGQRRQISEQRQPGGRGGRDEGPGGAPLMLRTIEGDKEVKFENVVSFNFTRDGENLFYMVSDKENPKNNGLYKHRPHQGNTVALLTGEGRYSNLTLDADEKQLAFFTDRDYQYMDEPVRSIYGGKLTDDKAYLWVSHTTTANFPEGMALVGGNISFVGENMLSFSIDKLPEPKKPEEQATEQNAEEEAKAEFELWHWNDPYPYPQQKQRISQMTNTSRMSVYHIDSRSFVQLGDDEISSINLSSDGQVGVANNGTPYTKMISYDGTYNDIYVVDTRTAKRTLVKKQHYGSASLSPGGKYLSWFEKGDWFVYDIAKKTTTNITESLDVIFEQEDHDTPNPPSAYRSTGWTEDDESILINDRYDIWEISPDGADARRITEGFGRANELSFSYVSLGGGGGRGGRGGGGAIDPQETLLLKAVDQQTMAQGFYHDRVRGDRLPRKLIMLDKSIGNPNKAADAERFMFTRSSFDEFPDLWISDTDFQNLHKISNVGKQLEKYTWGTAELRDFLSADGKPLKGILIKPENFDPQNKYPLMVYIYETLHDGLHSFKTPSIGTSINIAYYISNGYVVWQPDIEYVTGYPGRDALKCVLPGIQMLVREGFINPKAIGIQGHSWGGYQIAYMVTQTNIFAAAEAGAPVSNMVSAYGGIRWSSGMVRQFQYERTQSRIGASLWEVPMRYLENSPIFWADKIETPLLILHNDQDGAVPWYQGIELIMAMRRLNKVGFMFNYVGEEHGLRQQANQKDFTIRMQEFFDHYLKGAPAPDWMINGIQAWKK